MNRGRKPVTKRPKPKTIPCRAGWEDRGGRESPKVVSSGEGEEGRGMGREGQALGGGSCSLSTGPNTGETQPEVK
jgi:hypothetical protein